MHKLNILILGPKVFYQHLNELKPYLKFNYFQTKKISTMIILKFDVVICHEEYFEDKKNHKF